MDSKQHLLHEVLAPGIHVIRFLRPDLRSALDPIIGDDNVLYREMIELLEGLDSGMRVIINLGLVERFPTSFFQLLMRVRQFILSRDGEIYLCGFRAEILPTVELMGGAKLFHITSAEETAFSEAKRK